MWEGWIIFITGAHGSGKTAVSCELQRRLRILLSSFHVEVNLIEVSDAVKDWQILEGRVDPEALYTTEIASTKLHKFLWSRLALFRNEVVICCGAREKHLLTPPSHVIVRTCSIALTCSYETRRKRFFDRGRSYLLDAHAPMVTEEDIERRWSRLETREAELGLGELMIGCKAAISTTDRSVNDVVDWVINAFLLDLWRSV